MFTDQRSAKEKSYKFANQWGAVILIDRPSRSEEADWSINRLVRQRSKLIGGMQT